MGLIVGYLEFVLELVDLCVGVLDVEWLFVSVRVGGWSVGGFDLFCKLDLGVVVGFVCGGGVFGGVFSRLLCGVLGGGESLVQVFCVLGCLCLYGLVKKVVCSSKCYLASLGSRVLFTGLKFREFVVISSLVGVLF
ncbi:MAG: hypothetical protein FWC30_02175 [Candidatus Bathyarchaeota archaeon]|nr:hypothetical protein [Candidatus Termiticorpusculum sp.]